MRMRLVWFLGLVLIVSGCSGGPEILFIKIDTEGGGSGGGSGNDVPPDERALYTLNSSSTRRGIYKRQQIDGDGAFAVSCGIIFNPEYLHIKSRHFETRQFSIERRYFADRRANPPRNNPTFQQTDIIKVTLDRGETVTLNKINSCDGITVRSKFEYKVLSATIAPADASNAEFFNTKQRDDTVVVETEYVNCRDACKDNWCLRLPLSVAGQKKEIQDRLEKFDALLVNGDVRIAEVHELFGINSSNCTASDFKKVGDGHLIEGNQCGFKTSSSDYVDVEGTFPDKFNISAEREEGSVVYSFSPTILVGFIGENKPLVEGLNEKFSGGISSLQVTPETIFIGSPAQCMALDLID